MIAKNTEQMPLASADLDSFMASGVGAFTVDVEEWFQVGAFETTLERELWHSLESRVELQTKNILDLLDQLDIKATLFCLGWVAERYPALIREIALRGHEVACHGMDHRRLFTLTSKEFSQELLASKTLLEEASGEQIIGYRAPSFSLTQDVWWVYEALEEAGFKYSSSLYPVKTDHYGMAQAPRQPFLPIPGMNVLEIPMTVCDMPFRRFPASGGGYFRLLPYMFSKYLMKKGPVQAAAPGIFYMHPWEMDPGQPFIKEAPLLSRFRHYTGQKKLPNKLKKLAADFKWGRMMDIYEPLLNLEGRE